MTMKKSLGKRLISGATSALLAITYGIPSSIGVSTAAATNPDDGLPILDESYENSIWYRGGPLKVAGDFHIFAFDTAEAKGSQHVNGNVAAPHVIGGAFQPHQKLVRLLNVAGESWVADGSINEDALPDTVVPANYTLLDKSGSQLSYHSLVDKVTLTSDDGKTADVTHNVSAYQDYYYAHWSDKFIDFDALREYYRGKSDEYAALPDTEGIKEVDDNGNITVNLKPEGENIVNLKASDLLDADHGGFEHNLTINGLNIDYGGGTSTSTIKDGQYLVINIELDDPETYGKSEIGKATGEGAIGYDFLTSISKLKMYTIDGAEVKGEGEESYFAGTNVIYNFHTPSGGEIPKVELGAARGQVLAPNVDFYAAGVNGNIIAEKVHVTSETHMAFFMQPMNEETTGSVSAKKSWSDGEDAHSGQSVKLTLYRSIKADAKPEELAALTAEDAARYESEKTELENSYSENLKKYWKEIPLFESAIAKDETIPESGGPMGKAIGLYGLITNGNDIGKPELNKNALMNSMTFNYSPLYAFDDNSIGIVKTKWVFDENPGGGFFPFRTF